jgi:hypothetical protein
MYVTKSKMFNTDNAMNVHVPDNLLGDKVLGNEIVNTYFSMMTY